jgi:CheY-like chemotaxis protein
LFPMDDNAKIRQTEKPSVLVAEREPVARVSLADLLRDEGYQVFEAMDHVAAIDHINRNSDLNVILADLEMPAWSSIIKHARIAAPSAFILTMAGYGSVPNALEAERLGAHGYLLKPLVFVDVHQAINKLLTGRPIR